MSVHTLRYYEREGLLAVPVRRSDGGRRVYSSFDVDWLEPATRFRASGMPLADIRRYVELLGEGDGNEQERFRRVEAAPGQSGTSAG